MLPKPTPWKVEPEWQGKTAYIIGGGTSVKEQNLELLRGKNVIVINSSYLSVPWAQYLFFGDARWYNEQRRKFRLGKFQGRIVTCSAPVRGPNLLGLARINPPPGLTDDPTKVVSQRTSLQGGMGLARHLAVSRIVLLGADMKRADDGATHHHEPHPWPLPSGNSSWDLQMEHLRMIAEPLKERGIEVINTSLISRIDWWPKMTLEEAIQLETNNGK